MVMTKKEKARVEALLTSVALHRTANVEPDVALPDSYSDLATGWLFAGERSDFPRVEVACSSRGSHAFGRVDKTTTQEGRLLYSTKLLALKALRHTLENECAKRLRNIDRMIEAESVLEGG